VHAKVLCVRPGVVLSTAVETAVEAAVEAAVEERRHGFAIG
jgi:hypothetical protein